jgi:hypothetical protein
MLTPEANNVQERLDRAEDLIIAITVALVTLLVVKTVSWLLTYRKENFK